MVVMGVVAVRWVTAGKGCVCPGCHCHCPVAHPYEAQGGWALPGLGLDNPAFPISWVGHKMRVAEGKSILGEMCVTSMWALTLRYTNSFHSASLKASGFEHPVVLMRELRSVGAIVTIKWCGITVTQKSQITNISNYAKLHQLFAEVGEGVCGSVYVSPVILPSVSFALTVPCPHLSVKYRLNIFLSEMWNEMKWICFVYLTGFDSQQNKLTGKHCWEDWHSSGEC